MPFEGERAFPDLRRFFLGAVGRAPAIEVLALLRREKQAAEFFGDRYGRGGAARPPKRGGLEKADSSALGLGMTSTGLSLPRNFHDSL